MDEQRPTNKRMIVIISLIAIVLIAAVAVIAKPEDGRESSSTNSNPSSQPTSQTAQTDSSNSGPGSFKDGSYTATGSYSNPGGTSSLKVEITLKDGVITESTVTPEASGRSLSFQERFASGYKNLVVGKKIDDVNLSTVSGSSLTSEGFNAALRQIETKAQTDSSS